MEIRELTYLAVAVRILCSVIIGGLLGWERGLKHRGAGLRTHMLVCIGSCLIMITNHYVFQVFNAGDPVRLAAQVVSGIGFLGAGTIIVTHRSQIRGLTTAAGLWASAGVGLALGVGFYEAAVISAAAIMVVMTLMQRIDTKMHRKAKTIEVYIELESGYTLGDFLQAARNMHIDVFEIEPDQVSTKNTGILTYMATLKVEKRCLPSQVLDQIMELDSVSYIYPI